MPIGEVTTQHVAGRQINEFAEEIPARDPNKHINPIAQIIKANKSKSQSFLQCLIRACNCTLNKKHQYITDPAGRIIKPSQLFEYLGVITTGGVKCVICRETIEYDLLPYHFADHKLSLNTICKLFDRNFQDFEYRNSEVTFLGEVVEKFWQK